MSQMVKLDTLESLMVSSTPSWKRAMDVVGALVGLAISAPVVAAAAISIKLSSPGPVLFGQERVGLGGQPFTMYKLRTMVVDAEEQKELLLSKNERSGPAFKMRNDPRVTRVGRILRRFSIDELPQLLNVLQGHMSLVGPRPLPLDETRKSEPWHRLRLQVKPGLTGLWQVTMRDDDDFDNWVRLDIKYIRERSLRNDVDLLLRTIPAILSGKGAC